MPRTMGLLALMCVGLVLAGLSCSTTAEAVGTTPVCGDRVIEPGEQCDDGTESATCNTDCTAAACGDGVVNRTAGEECERGLDPPGTCSRRCAVDREWAAWAIPFEPPPPDAYTLGPGVVTDSQTGLTWTRCTAGNTNAECGGLPDYRGLSTLPWPLADAFCAELAFGGHTDWRLPTAIELASVAKDTLTGYGMDPSIFFWASDWVWSSTLHAPRGATAWVMSPVSGILGNGDLGGRYVWTSAACVRPGVSPPPGGPVGAPAGRYVIEGAVVRDVATGLSWRRCPLGMSGDNCETGTPTEVGFADASAACAGVLDDGGGWRVPTHNELQSIVDRRTVSPAIDVRAFPGTRLQQPYWTNVMYVVPPWGTAYAVVFDDGMTATPNDLSIGFFVRCVR